MSHYLLLVDKKSQLVRTCQIICHPHLFPCCITFILSFLLLLLFPCEATRTHVFACMVTYEWRAVVSNWIIGSLSCPEELWKGTSGVNSRKALASPDNNSVYFYIVQLLLKGILMEGRSYCMFGNMLFRLYFHKYAECFISLIHLNAFFSRKKYQVYIYIIYFTANVADFIIALYCMHGLLIAL